MTVQEQNANANTNTNPPLEERLVDRTVPIHIGRGPKPIVGTTCRACPLDVNVDPDPESDKVSLRRKVPVVNSQSRSRDEDWRTAD